MMMKKPMIFYLMILAMLAAACGQKTASAGKESLAYSSKNALMGMSMAFVLSDEELQVAYQSGPNAAPESQSYSLKEGEAQKLFEMMKSIDFHDIEMPADEKRTDAGESLLTATYGGKTRTINLSNSSALPGELQELRLALFALAKTYQPALAQKMGL